MNIKKIWDWIVLSSADAEKISLMVKGFLMGILPLILIMMHAANIQTSNELLTAVIDTIAQVIVVAGTGISSLVTVVGLIRKIYFTLTGQNDVLMMYATKGE